MTFFASYLRDKAFNFAISQLGLFDQDTFDLKKQGITLGSTTVLELRDVPLSTTRLTELLKLPPYIALTESRILSLRLTIPLNFFSNNISVEVDGIRVKLLVTPEGETTRRNNKPGLERGVKANFPRTTDDENQDGSAILTPDDLAKSFLANETDYEKAQIRSAILKSQRSRQYGSPNDATDVGLGPDISLQGLSANMMKGILDRFKAVVSDIQIEALFKLPLANSNGSAGLEEVTFCLDINNVDIPPVSDQSIDSSNEKIKSPGTTRARNISITGVHGSLLSTSALSSFMTQLSRSQSPALSRATSKLSDTTLPSRRPILRSSPASMAQSVISSHRRPSSVDSSDGAASHLSQFRATPRSLERIRPTANSMRDSRRSVSTTIEDPSTSGFGLDSQALSASDILNIQSESAVLQRSEFDANDSVQDSSTFLSQSQLSDTHHDRIRSSTVASGAEYGGAASWMSSPKPQTASVRMAEEDMQEDLTQSKYFSDDEARSIYMSAMSLVLDESDIRQSQPDISASTHGLNPEEPTNDMKPTASTTSSRGSLPSSSISRSRPGVHERQSNSDASDDDSPPVSLLASVNADEPSRSSSTMSKTDRFDSPSTIEASTPRVTAQSAFLHIGSRVLAKSILVIDKIAVQLPPASNSTDMDEIAAAETGSTKIPGAFSVHESVSSTYSTETSSVPHREAGPEKSEARSTISVVVFNMVISFDMALVRLAILVAGLIPNKQSEQLRTTVPSNKAVSKSSLTIACQRCIVRFEDALPVHERFDQRMLTEFLSQAFDTNSQDLLRLLLAEIKIEQNQDQQYNTTEISVSKASFGFPDEDILSFTPGVITKGSTDLSSPDRDISIKITQPLGAIKPGEAALQLNINTAPLHINVNIKRLAEALDWLGGLSTVLELGNSMRSTIIITKPLPPSVKARPREVRFNVPDSTSRLETQKAVGTRVGVHVRGLSIDILGAKACVRFQSSLFGVVSQSGSVRARFSHVTVSGPMLGNDTRNSPLLLQIEQIGVSFLEFPDDKDMERLLALVSPRPVQDEPDDDIMLDTLLRQRRKGAVLRLDVKTINVQISDPDKLQHFTSIGEELSQLSSVTKYLPEDDKPGLLILVGINQLKVDLDINKHIRGLMILLERTEIACVTFPSLLLCSIGDLTAVHDKTELISRATPDIQNNSARQIIPIGSIPKLNLKFIAGEMEPTLRTKIYNLRIDYHVSTAMVMLGINETADGNVIVAQMVDTIANLAAVESESASQSETTSQNSDHKNQKPLRLDISIRDTILALNPKGKSSQGLLVLTDCHFSGIHAEDGASISSGDLEVPKASLLLTDDTKTILQAEQVTDPSVVMALGTKPTQIQCLQAVGYVSVAQVSSAKIKAQLRRLDGRSQLDVTLRDPLLILETCPDSMQTLLAVMGSLAPPSPPQEGVKYRTEVNSMQDILSSFSSHAFAGKTDSQEVSTNFDGPAALPVDSESDPELDEDFLDSELEPGYESVAFGLGSMASKQSVHYVSDSHDPAINSREEIRIEDSMHLGQKHYGPKSGPQLREWDSQRKIWYASDPTKISDSPMRIYLENIHFLWNMFDGFDWKKTRETISQAVDEVESKAEERRAARRERLRQVVEEEEEEVIGDMLFNSIYISVAAKQDPRELRARINGVINDTISETGSYATSTTQNTITGRPSTPKTRRQKLRLERSKKHKMTIEISGLSGQVISFPPGSGETQSVVDIKVKDLEIFDNVPTSTWKKFATGLQATDDRPFGANMIHLELITVKPEPDLLASEVVLNVEVLPLRLHVDQDALDFMTRYFEFRVDGDTKAGAPTDLPFIQYAKVESTDLKLDFKPKRVDWWALRSGKTSEFMNFIILDSSPIHLRSIEAGGFYGFDKLGRLLNDVWTADVISNQLPGVLSGLGPVKPLIDIGKGMAGLWLVPRQDYKRNGRLAQAVQKGVVHFGKNTTTEVVRLGAKLATGAHTVLSSAEALLVPEDRRPKTTLGEDTDEAQSRLSPYANQPIGVKQGLRGAYRGLERDLLIAKDAIVAMPGEIMDNETAAGAAVAFARTAPTIILRPVMGVTKAIGQTLMGATNTLDKNERRRIEDKYKHR